MGKYYILIGTIVAVLIITLIIVIVVKKKKKKPEANGYIYEGEKKVIDVSNINEIDKKYRNDSLNLSTSYTDTSFETTNKDIEIEILEDHFSEDVTDQVAENNSNSLNDQTETLEDNEIAFGINNNVINTKLCPNCKTNIDHVKDYCPGCGRPIDK